MCPFWDILFWLEGLRGTTTTEKECTLSVIWFMFELHGKIDRQQLAAWKTTGSSRTNLKDKTIWIINWRWKLTIGSSFWLWNTLKVPMLFYAMNPSQVKMATSVTASLSCFRDANLVLRHEREIADRNWQPELTEYLINFFLCFAFVLHPTLWKFDGFLFFYCDV